MLVFSPSPLLSVSLLDIANPAIALIFFSVNWGGSGGNGVATTCASIWFGCALLFIAGTGEFILGNTFPMIVFFGYGAHFATQATTFIPWFNSLGFFSPTGDGAPIEGLTPTFLSSFGMYPLIPSLILLADRYP